MKRQIRGILSVPSYLFVGLMLFLQLVPFYITLTVAFKPKTELTSRWLLPKELYLENFVTAIERGNVLSSIGNSVVVTAAAIILICFLGSFAAYPLARIKSRFNKFVLILILGVMMVPPLSILVPLYSMMNTLNGINSYWAIILVMTTIQLPLSIFLYSSFISSIPVELEEAALIDGCNYLQIFYRIILPLLRPVTASVIILTGIFVWNEYQLSLYILSSPAKRTIAPAIGSFFSQSTTNLGAAAAASLLAVLPLVLLYLFLQRYFIKGMVDSAIK